MNCRIIIAILFLYAPVAAFSQWKEADPLPVGHVRGLFEIGTDQKIYATGEESFFRSTNANGDSWTPITLKKPFTINYIQDYGSKLLIGTDKHGIWEYYPEEQNPNNQWKDITENLFANETLKGENLSVNAIAASGDIVLANVYHEGNPTHGGSHSRIYASRDGGKTWKRASELTNSHNFIYSFTIDESRSRVIASTSLDGILIANIDDPALKLTQVSKFVAKKLISLGRNEFIGLPNNTSEGVLYRSIDNGDTWSAIPINDAKVKAAITDIAWGSDAGKFYLYASTYDGIFKITLEDFIALKAWQTEYPASAYISNIRTKSTNKFATAETGVLRRLAGSTQWAKAENGLKINYVYATHANDKYVLAVTDNGLYRSTVDLVNNKFTWQPIERNVMVLDDKNRFLETKRAVIATNGTGPTEEIIVATNNSIIQSKDAGATWTKGIPLPVSSPVPVDQFDPTKVSFVSYQENVQAIEFVGNDLFAVAYETPLLLKNRQGAWKELKEGLPARGLLYNGSIKGMQEIAGEVYIYWEDYSSALRGAHDIWDYPVPEKSGVYKFDVSLNRWVLVKSLDKSAKIHGFVANGDSLIFSAQYKDDPYTFYSLDVKTTQLQTFDHILANTENYVRQMYTYGSNLFMTNTVDKRVHVSADGGKSWLEFDDALSTVSALAVSNNMIYGGITGNGLWYRNFYELFPVEAVEPFRHLDLVQADDNNQITESSTDTISIHLNTNIPGTTVTLYTRSITRNNWKKWPVTSNSKKFSVKLPHDQFDEVGLAYYWEIIPPAAYRNPLKPVIIAKDDTTKVAIQYPKGRVIPEKLKTDKNPKKTPYRMISFPLLSDNNTLGDMLGDELDLSGDNGDWRFTYYGGKNSNGTITWEDVRARNSTLNLAQGYWLAATKKGAKNEQITISPGKTVATELKTDADGNFFYEVPLRPNDWTQIGNPFLIHINWADVRNYSLNKQLNLGELITQAGNDRKGGENTTLAAFSGGYIKNETSDTVLRIPVMRNTNLNGGRKSAEQEIAEDAVMAVGFSIQSSDLTCYLPGLGIHPEADGGLDKFDLVIPPSPGDFPTMRFITQAAGKQAITRSIVPPLEEGQQWEFTITGVDAEEKATLNWQEYKVEAGKMLWLHDLEGERKVDMLTAHTYQFMGARRFRVYYGSEQYLKEHVLPEQSVLAVYPNPVDDQATISFTLPKSTEDTHVTLTLLDARGSLMQVIHESDYGTGFHELVWNTGAAVQKLPQGLYLVELELKSMDGTHKYYQKVVKK